MPLDCFSNASLNWDFPNFFIHSIFKGRFREQPPIVIWCPNFFLCSHLDSGKGKLYVSGADGIMYRKSLDDHFVSTLTDYLTYLS